MFPAKVMLVLKTARAVQKLSWKEQLTSLAEGMEYKNKAELLARLATRSFPLEDLLQEVNAKEDILKSTIFMKLRPTDSMQMIVAVLPKEDSPHIVSLSTLATVILVLRTWSPGKNTIVVLEVKYRSASFAYSESVVQLAEFRGQDEHDVAVGVTQYTFSAQQKERVLMSSATTRTTDGAA